MSLWQGKKASAGGGEVPDPIPGGTHPAVLVAMIDLGTQEIRFGNQEPEWDRKIFLCWEVFIHSDSGSFVKTQMIGKEYRLSFHPKAALMGLLQRWRGKEYAEGDDVALDKWLGTAGAIAIEETTSGENTYSKVSGVTKLMAGVAKPTPTVKPILWELGSKEPVPTWLPYSFGKSIPMLINQSKEVASGSVKPIPGVKAPAAAPVNTNNVATQQTEALAAHLMGGGNTAADDSIPY